MLCSQDYHRLPMDAAQTRSHGRAEVRRGPTKLVLGRTLIHVALPLVIGTLAYAAWRSSDVRVVAWMSRLAPRGVAAAQGTGASHVPAIIAGSLPDAAWAWAFGASLSLVWYGRAWREKAAWLAAGALVALSAEIGQAFGVVPGTFDVVDLMAIAVGFAAGAWLAGRRRAVAASPTEA
jgi:hypothetical protein